jgi:hypothetical protein
VLVFISAFTILLVVLEFFLELEHPVIFSTNTKIINILNLNFILQALFEDS